MGKVVFLQRLCTKANVKKRCFIVLPVIVHNPYKCKVTRTIDRYVTFYDNDFFHCGGEMLCVIDSEPGTGKTHAVSHFIRR